MADVFSSICEHVQTAGSAIAAALIECESLALIAPAVGVGPLRLTERAGADRCGHVKAFLLPRGMALTGGYLLPPRRAWELLRRGIDPPAGLR
jgi:hypothetical protein